jgi:hypothetical protein
MVASLPVSTEEILLELTPKQMDLETRIWMPEDRGPDRLVGRAHWAFTGLMSAKATRLSAKKNTDFRSVIGSGSFDLGAIHRYLSRDGGAAGAACHRPFVFKKLG